MIALAGVLNPDGSLRLSISGLGDGVNAYLSGLVLLLLLPKVGPAVKAFWAVLLSAFGMYNADSHDAMGLSWWLTERLYSTIDLG